MFDRLDFVYLPSRDVAADVRHFTGGLGAELVTPGPSALRSTSSPGPRRPGGSRAAGTSDGYPSTESNRSVSCASRRCLRGRW